MKQIFNMTSNEVRNLAREYIRQGVTSRAIQCFERLRWLGKLRQHEYLFLYITYARQGKVNAAKDTIERYNRIYTLQ